MTSFVCVCVCVCVCVLCQYFCWCTLVYYCGNPFTSVQHSLVFVWFIIVGYCCYLIDVIRTLLSEVRDCNSNPFSLKEISI